MFGIRRFCAICMAMILAATSSSAQLLPFQAAHMRLTDWMDRRDQLDGRQGASYIYYTSLLFRALDTSIFLADI